MFYSLCFTGGTGLGAFLFALSFTSYERDL